MKWLVTGGLGFVGSQLVRDLLDQNDEVLILDNESRRAPDSEYILSHSCCSTHICDLEDLKSFETRALDFDADYYVHLAAMHYIPECNADPQKTITTNILATQNILHAFCSSAAKRFTFISSGAIYQDSSGILTEKDPIAPVDIYGVSKFAGELLCSISERKNDITVVRLFNVFGPRETNPHIIPEIIKQLRSSLNLRLGNVDTVRDFIHVQDASSGILKATIELDKFSVLNLSGGVASSMRDIISIISDLLQKQITISTDPEKFRAADKQVQKADITRMLTSTNWSPTVGLQDGLQDLLRIEGLGEGS